MLRILAAGDMLALGGYMLPDLCYCLGDVAQGRKTGGRTAGTPNKATKHVREFLEKVFTEVFDDAYHASLVRDIRGRTIEPKLLITLLAYYAGRPAQAVDHTHAGTLRWAQVVAGDVPEAELEAEDDDDEDEE